MREHMRVIESSDRSVAMNELDPLPAVRPEYAGTTALQSP